MACNCGTPNPSGNPVYGIPVKIGAPMSTACQRATNIGSIPEVINYPGFTLINRGLQAGKVSNGGIQNPRSFFENRNECFGSENNQLSGAECCTE